MSLSPNVALAKNRFLNRAERAYNQLDYDYVLPLLDRAMRIRTTRAERVKIFQLRAFIHVTYGRDSEARDAFVKVLRLKPKYTLPPDTSPKILAALASAREQLDPSFQAPEPSFEPQSPQPGEETPTEETLAEAAPEPPPELAPPEALLPPPDQQKPTEISAVTKDDGSVLNKWWFWTIVGVAVAGGGVAAWQLGQAQTPDFDVGPIPLR